MSKKLHSINEVFDSAVVDECGYQCPDGSLASQNKFYSMTNSGCRNFGMTIDTEYLPSLEIENCCNEQNICYGTCNKDKELCDLEFKRCLYKFCDQYENKTGSEIIIKGNFVFKIWQNSRFLGKAYLKIKKFQVSIIFNTALNITVFSNLSDF